ncbi:ATP-dependent DNA helicase [Aetokthonos hydrillicola Thurmond2011]|jgi:ATP-dependent DNA helicase RecQ|uniref:ATP-dependent DNA helicase RecQ n=1 Tax=Aetokthonos hydrillicola Thurmond2011 TaxID=2712845 RepID=A0AAP5I2Q6_9CYAN|nr:ATP-dependent DNA helicase RecQ [Aetokthonos hydrillicola]MBO3460893.1 ATP-dependent DNA helicase RecQ [Aetokthonos hydrillicola CCALA 1050]MBW4586443.1 ATP-dependent DNA helicase [Aetokthonos hydrillicola CCALA 1050]MDR9893611.1 ATP-dependent DNA helicase [Aetokthonos hydrillicola Thurmond2011]
MNQSSTISWDDVRATFQKIWGYKDFRPPQGEIIETLLAKKDALIIMPTGGGKSICFQLPALLQTGLTLVVSPLVALMENQVQELRSLKLSAALLHSELPSFQRRQTLQALNRQQLRLLYLSPETLLSEPVWNLLSQPRLVINGLILDEAHCLVQWGDTFRPTYRRLGSVRPALLKSKPPGTKIALAAFTATADPAGQRIIKETLQLQEPAIFHINPYRSNLNLSVRIAWTPRGRKQQVLKFIQNRAKQTGLVYVRTRRDSENLAEWLRQNGLATEGYHAGLLAEERRAVEASWLSGKIPFVVCTSAFGMGINKPDVRWVIHFHAPLLLSEYVQEIGRAGRDGKPADTLTLMSEPTGWLDPEDKQRRRFFEERVRSLHLSAQQLVKKLPQQGEVNAVEKKFPDGAIALSLLHSAGQLHWLDPFHYSIIPGTRNQPPRELASAKQMNHYLTTRQCRWQFLLNAFGFDKEAASWRCRHCDNCRRNS